MFHSSREDRISPLVACQNLRNGYKPGYFLSLGMGDLAPVIIKPVLPADTWSDDNSIFRFRELDIEGVFEPLVMLGGCYVVNLRYVLKAKFEDKVDIEFATYKILESFEHTCWRFKSTNRLPERYIKIEPALELCEGEDHLQCLVDVLRKQEALRNKAMAKFAARKENKDKKSKNDGPGMSQLGLVESISTSDSIIAITKEGRTLLVRARDGYIHEPSIRAVAAKRLLSTDAVEDESAY